MVDYHPFSESVMNDAHPIYRSLRDEAPAFHVDEYDCWALSRFDDVWNAAQDPETYSAAQGTTAAHLLTKDMEVFPALDMMDPPDHTKRRVLISNLFTPGRARRLEPVIREIVTTRLDVVRDRGRFDVVTELGSFVSTGTVVAALELPQEDGESLRQWVDAIFYREPDSIGITESGIAAYGHLDGYFLELIARRRGEPAGDDVLGRFLTAEIDGVRFSDEVVASHMKELIIAGTETLPKMLAATLRRLAEHPDQRREVQANADLVLPAFMEAVRLDMPTQFMGRMIVRDHELHGLKLRKGQPVLLLYPSASRDEREFENPDAYDIHRDAPRSVGFGHGTHACLGRHVARLEAKITLTEILARIPDYQVDLAGATRVRTEFVQGFSSLPIVFAS